MNVFTLDVLQRKWVIPTIVGSISFCSGVGVGYIISKYKTSEEDVVAVEENMQMTIFDSFDDWETEVEQIVEEFISEDIVIEEEIPEITYENRNVFSDGELSHWDYESELLYRGDGQPYIIHYDEFMNNETNYPQETLTYYQEDDIVADQQDSPIYNYASLMGELRFGHGSNDPNVVYIRNDQIHMEWEILLHHGSFSYEVAGIDKIQEYESEDLRHSNNRKFRMD